MDDLQLGAWVRAERRRRHMRQIDLARVAGVSDQTVVRVEHGRCGDMTLGRVRSVAAGVGIRVLLAARSVRGSDLERQVDSRHAALVETVTAILGANDWDVTLEWSFNYYGDRGCVDVLAWHSGSGALLILEAKSELVDLQQTLRALDVKRRLVPGLFSKETGSRIRALGIVLAVADDRTERARVQRHAAIFGAALPARTVEVKRWTRSPNGSLRGLWFVQMPRLASGMRDSASRRRVRVSARDRLERGVEAGRAGEGGGRGPSPNRDGEKPEQPTEYVDSAATSGLRAERSGRRRRRERRGFLTGSDIGAG